MNLYNYLNIYKKNIGMRLTRFLLGLDKLGHSLTIKYKGKGMHQTKLGSFITIVIQILVIVMLVNRTTELV